ncbi:hypothetical protein BEH94_00065 [Candidatus Altiarchaeales archaeon WOR_SM1_SCG]|nr:hypothetical protein BEH94_00065 [Candidatus Altiarchaeales archaeon WOR_SM1_SCG]
MPYKCTQCGKIYMDGSDELREVVKRGGCECGKKLLMYIREPVEEIEEDIRREIEKQVREERKVKEKKALKKGKQRKTKEGKKESEKENPMSDMEWLDKEFTDKEKEDKPVYFDIETVQRLEEGEFKLDVASLMSGKPYVVKAEEGVYYIHVPSAMKKKKEREE